MFYYGQLAILPNGTANFFQMLHTLGEKGAKKSSKPFSDLLLLCAAVMGGGYSVVFAYFSSVNWELSLQGLFFSK